MAGPLKMCGFSGFGNSPLHQEEKMSKKVGKVKKQDEALGRVETQTSSAKYDLPYKGLQIVDGKHMHGDKEVSRGDYKKMMKANMLAEAETKN